MSFYKNDPAETPRQNVGEKSGFTMKFIHVLATLHLLMLNESITGTTMSVPCCVVVLNFFMNSVNLFDQLRATNIILCRGQRFPMSICAYLFEASIQNYFTLLKYITVPGEVNCSLHEFKRRISVQSVELFLEVIMKNITFITISTVITETVSLQAQ